jgi:hypothetical protein
MNEEEKNLFKELILNLVTENFKLKKKIKLLEGRILSFEEEAKKEYRKNIIKNIKH